MLQNSLFGKFAMKRTLINHEIVNKNEVKNFISEIGFDNLVKTTDIGNKTII